MAAASDGIFQKDKPLDFAVPLFIVQVVFVLALTRGLAFLLKPLRQPRVIAEMLGGILLGPSALGKNTIYLNHIFPKKSIPVLDTFANIGLLFFLFMVGMELDLREVRKTGRVAMTIAVAGIAAPFAGGVGISFLMKHTINKGAKLAPFLVFMGVAMSITAFPVLARILAERKLLTTDVGRMAMSAAVVNDVVAWILLALAVALSGNNVSPAIAAWVLLSAAGFVIFMFVAVKPCLEWVVKRNPENEPVREIYICMTIAAVLAAGFITDLIGIHAIFGAFIFGLIVPKDGPFAGAMIEKLEDVVSTLMLPLYFASSGLKTDIGAVHGAQAGGILVAVVCVACGGKILATVFASMLNHMEARKALALGILMNTKGLVELIVLNIGRDRGVLTDEIFAIMVLMALFTTFMTTPLIMTIYKPARNKVPYTQRTLGQVSDKENRELRLLACIRGLKHVPAMINFTEATRGTRKRPIRLYVLHMMQMSERSSAILLVQRARKDGIPYFPGGQGGDGNKDQVTFAFEAYAQLSKVTVRPMTAISGFEDMHEDICTTASDKRITLLIVPFHKQIGHDGLLDQGKAGFRSVNQRILQHAPCSVAVVVNRGLGGNAQLSPNSVEHNILVLFFGGPDDREALTLACRMVEHPGVRLSVFRFFQDTEPEHVVDSMPELDPSASNSSYRTARNKNLDSSEEDSDPSDTPTSPSRSATGGSARSAIHASPHSGMPSSPARSGMLSSPVHSMMSGSPSQSQYIFHTLGIDQEDQRLMDEECVHYATQVLEARPFDGNDGMTYAEVLTTDAVESALEYAKADKYDLILVGRNRIPTLLVARCTQPAREFAELGPIGDALTSELQGVPTEASVIVMQQYDPSLVQL